jgi:DNA-binding CsgD family transcriptional regulator
MAHPVSRWHLLRCEAVLAQATGRFDDALASATEACALFGRLEDRLGAMAMQAGFETVLAVHTGFHDGIVERWDAIDLRLAPPFLGDLPVLGPLLALAGAGDLDRARSLYDRLVPMDAWSPPRFLWLHLHAVRLGAALALGRVADVEALVAELDRHRGTHIGTGGGGLSYFGPVELWIGVGDAGLGRWDEATAALRDARQTCERIGAGGFAVQAGVELARTLVRRGEPSDRDEAGALVVALAPVAAALGMAPWVEALADLEQTTDGRRSPGPLTARELEVAGLVAEGLTNRDIAARLYLSDRTAQNHVQHILTKLGLSNRTQIARWYRER